MSECSPTAPLHSRIERLALPDREVSPVSQSGGEVELNDGVHHGLGKGRFAFGR